MAPVQLESEVRYGPVAAVASHLAVAVYLAVQASRSLHKAYQSLGPSQDTRARVAWRSRLLPVFSALALLSLARAVVGFTDCAVLSYKVWASNLGVELPTRFYGDGGILNFGGSVTPIYPVKWLSDTPVYLDAIEIVAEKARRYWWGQQVDLGLVSWGMLLAIEGRRRNIPFLWCYQLLAQLVSLAFTLNLFFVAVLLTPLPLPIPDGSLSASPLVRLRNRIFSPKPANWVPHASVFFTILALNFATITLSPYQVNTDNFKYLVLASRLLTLAPLTAHYVVPLSWGSTYRDLQDVYGTYKRLFKTISLASFLLHARATVLALIYSAPNAYHHRHSVHLPFDVEQRSAWERTTSAFGRVLEATSDHPVVGAVGWDVILAGVSIGLWVATRATDVPDVLASTLPVLRDEPDVKDETTAETRRVTRQKAKGLRSESEVNGSGTRRGRRAQHVKQDPDDSAYEPEPCETAAADEGDVLPRDEPDWESAAVVWGLTALGGLGVGCAGAFGGEVIAR